MSIEETNKIAGRGIQPDLFIASDEAEFRYALEVAREQIEGVPRAKFYITDQRTGQYEFTTCYNGENHNIGYYIIEESESHRDYKAIFPDMTFYVLIPINGNTDHIAVQISGALWPGGPDYDNIVLILTEEGFTVEEYTSRNYYEKYIKPFYIKYMKANEEKHMISPWTVRDYETLSDCLQEGDTGVIRDKAQIDNIVIYNGINFELIVRPDEYRSLQGSSYTRLPREQVDYKFPNSIVIHYKDGTRIPVYVSPLVSIDEIRMALNNAGLEYTEELVTDENIEAAVIDSLQKPRFGKYADPVKS